jgi:hypothetical protein
VASPRTAATPAAEAEEPAEVERPARRDWWSVLPYLAAVVVTSYVCRDVLVGHYFGDTGDARWTVSLHEHWFRVWQGKEAIRDLVSYVPLKSVLGTSDAFLVQGQIYSVLRSVGVDLAPAWAWTQILMLLVGALGVAALSRRLLRWVVSQAAFTVLVCASYAFVVDLVHVQLIGVLSCAWVVVGIIDLALGRNTLRSLALVLVVPPLIAASSWYALVLLAIVLAVVGGYLLVLSDLRAVARGLRDRAATVRSLVRRPPRLIAAIATVTVSVALWGITAWIYLPAKNLLPRPTWGETTLYSPRYSDIVNAGWAGGGIWGRWYALYFDPTTYNVEQPHGFTPVLFVAFMALGLYNVRRAVLSRTVGMSTDEFAGPRVLGALWLATLSVVLLFIVDERHIGPFAPIWTYVPGMDSIRSPFRIQTLSYALAFFVILRSAELIQERLRSRARLPERHARRGARGARTAIVASVLLVAFIFVEGQRPFVGLWSASQLLSPALVRLVPGVRASCDTVIVDASGDDEVTAQIDGVMLATLAGVTTPQGYGRAEPIGHPPWTAKSPELATWMRSQGYEGRICSVSEASPDITRLT